jgi:hypothetical protein
MHVSQLYRFALRGKRVNGDIIKLKAVKLPGGWAASVSAWRRFVGALTDAAAGRPVGTSLPITSRTDSKRQSEVESSIDALRRQLGKRLAAGGP